MVSVDIKQHGTMLRHWSQFVPNMSTDIQGHEVLLYHDTLPTMMKKMKNIHGPSCLLLFFHSCTNQVIFTRMGSTDLSTSDINELA